MIRKLWIWCKYTKATFFGEEVLLDKTKEKYESYQKRAQEPKAKPSDDENIQYIKEYNNIKIQYEHKRISKWHVRITGMK